MTKDGMQGRYPPMAMAAAKTLAPAGLAALFAEVQTARLVLRRVQVGDGPAMFAVRGDPATNQHNSAGPDPDLATSEEVLQQWLHCWERDGYGYWTVTLADTGTIIGFGGVMRRAWRDRDVLNLYYRLTPSAWGQGYATELTRIAMELARAYLPHMPVIVRTGPANIASQRTAERAGLRRRPDLDIEDGDIVFALGWTPASAPADQASGCAV